MMPGLSAFLAIVVSALPFLAVQSGAIQRTNAGIANIHAQRYETIKFNSWVRYAQDCPKLSAEPAVLPRGHRAIVSIPAIAGARYRWSLSDGRIDEGQGTPMIIVNTHDTTGNVIVTLKVSPQLNCPELTTILHIWDGSTTPPADSTLIAGVVRDKEGRGLAGVTISASKTGGFKKLSLTEQGGAYVLNELETGTYNVLAKLAGFSLGHSRVSLVRPGDQRLIRFELIKLRDSGRPKT